MHKLKNNLADSLCIPFHLYSKQCVELKEWTIVSSRSESEGRHKVNSEKSLVHAINNKSTNLNDLSLFDEISLFQYCCHIFFVWSEIKRRSCQKITTEKRRVWQEFQIFNWPPSKATARERNCECLCLNDFLTRILSEIIVKLLCQMSASPSPVSSASPKSTSPARPPVFARWESPTFHTLAHVNRFHTTSTIVSSSISLLLAAALAILINTPLR